MSRRGVAAVAAVLSTLAFAGSAQAAQRLEAYKIKLGKGTTLEQIAKLGYDVTEGFDGNSIEVVATRDQARRLAREGLRPRLVRTRGGRTVLQAHAAQAVNGWKVWRPYARTDITDELGNQADNIKTQLEQLAEENPEIVDLQTIGRTHSDVPIYALKVTRNARRTRDGSRPSVLFSAVQHAREWLAGETNLRTLRMFVENYGETGTAVGVDGQPIEGVSSEELTRLVDTRELWFVPIANPDGYDFSFTPAQRLWRKNLRDNDGDGRILSFGDGVDLNRNFPTHWGYDDEGSSGAPWNETYRGPAPASEPETRALDRLLDRVGFTWNKNDHTHGRLLLYPFGWQVDTHAADEPIFKAITGIDDDNPAIPTFDPDLGAELYTTNGDTNDHLYDKYRTISFTPEGTPAATGSGFVFQDVPADVQAEFERHVQFALDLARSADPSRPESHLGNEVPDFEVDSFDVSYGSPQTVQVNARRDLGPIVAKYQIDGGPTRTASTKEWRGGERYGDKGDYWYHRMRGSVRGAQPGDEVKVWFEAPREDARSESFTYTLQSDSGDRVLILAAEDYTGNGNAPQETGRTEPKFLGFYEAALADNGIAYDVYDVDAMARTAPHPLGVLDHYDAIVWYTGDDVFTQGPGVTGTTRVDRIAHTTQMAVRDFMNEGGKLLYSGKYAGLQYTTSSYPEPGQQAQNCDNNVAGTTDRCLPLSNDFLQYYLGAYQRIAAGGLAPGSGTLPLSAFGDPFAGLALTLDGEDSARNQDTRTFNGATALFVNTGSALPPDQFPQFRSRVLGDFHQPGGGEQWAPHSGQGYAWSNTQFLTHKRLTRTIDLRGRDAGALKFWAVQATQANRQFLFVEAHTAGEDDWTTLPERNGATTQTTGAGSGAAAVGCASSFDQRTWFDYFPFLSRYMTRDAAAPTGCRPQGTTGEWHATTGLTGWRELDFDLSRYAGKKVEVSISLVIDWGSLFTRGTGVDDVTVTRGTSVETEGFERGLGAWSVPGAPEGTTPNGNDWLQTGRTWGAITGTRDGFYLGFGLEGVTGRATRADLMGRALGELLAREDDDSDDSD